MKRISRTASGSPFAAPLLGVAAVTAVAVFGTAAPALAAQDTPPAAAVTFPDIPANHWAYQAVNDLASKGYVKGYPEGVFLGQRAMTRYEFATVIDRILQTVNDMAAKIAAQAAAPPATPTGNFATQDDLNKIQALMDTFQKQLAAIGTPISPVQDQIDALRTDIADMQVRITKLEAASRNAYGYAGYGVKGSTAFPGATGAVRPFQLGGYIQARYQDAMSGNRLSYPPGTSAVVGGAASYNGNYATGGANQDLFTRRVRLKFTGEMNPNTRYAVQLDAQNNPTSSNQSQVQILDANGQYTFGDGDPFRHPTVVAGAIINYFGYVLPQSPADFLAPERPLAFSEGGNGMWQNQDFDKGAYVNIPLLGCLNAMAGVLDGNGRFSQNNKPNADTLYRVAYTKSKLINIGASYYDGELARASAVNPSGEPTFTGANYAGGRKSLGGADVQIYPSSAFKILGEYVYGRFDERTFASAEDSAHGNAETTLTQNAFAPGNKVDGWYVQAAYTLFAQRTNTLTFAGGYDVFDRSKSGISGTTVDAQGNPVLGGASGSSFTDKNWGGGILYKLSKAAQIKFWYEDPTAVAHAANLPDPRKVGLFTTELMVRY